MLALHSGSAGIGHEQALIVLFAIIAVIFWRDVIKIAIMIGALLLIIGVSSGAVVLLDLLQHRNGGSSGRPVARELSPRARSALVTAPAAPRGG
jgi:hypothetical protein